MDGGTHSVEGPPNDAIQHPLLTLIAFCCRAWHVDCIVPIQPLWERQGGERGAGAQYTPSVDNQL